jgi:CheY-like chemotaxis protein
MNRAGQNQTLLLVDDNKHLLITLSDYLTYEGFRVVTANSGEKAIKLLEDLTPDLIILDISMPGIGGIGFLNKFQKDNTSPLCPVIVFTARVAMREFFDTLNVAGFMAKPCSEVDILNKITEVLGTQTKHHGTTRIEAAKVSILLGENDTGVSRRLVHEFKQTGYTYQIAVTGAGLLEQAALMKPSIIVMKEILPGMNGRAVAPLVHAMPVAHNIPIILYDETRSVYDEKCYSQRIPEGVTRYLTTNESPPLLTAIKQYTS